MSERPKVEDFIPRSAVTFFVGQEVLALPDFDSEAGADGTLDSYYENLRGKADAFETAWNEWNWRERPIAVEGVAPTVTPAPFLVAFHEAMEKRNADS